MDTLFKEFPKIARLNRDIIITEKIDGTNGVIYIGAELDREGKPHEVFLVGSRNKWITPENDNHGFAKWAYANKEELLKLGAGYHYGEFWGNEIQRGYGLPKDVHKFSLFNIARWSNIDDRPKCCELVPILYQGMFSELAITDCLGRLREHGSYAAPFMNPEGIIVFHTASRTMYKVTLEGDEKPKSLNE